MIMGWGFKINPKSKIDLKIEKEDGDIIKYKTKFIKKYQLNHTGMIKNLSLIWVQNSKPYLRVKLGIENRKKNRKEKGREMGTWADSVLVGPSLISLSRVRGPAN